MLLSLLIRCTGVVGTELLNCLEKREYPSSKVLLFAHPDEAGQKLSFRGEELTIAALSEESFKGVDIALFGVGDDLSKKFAPIAVSDGCVVIDNSAAYRMDPDVPLVVPEVNPQAALEHNGIIANPNCSTIIMNVPVFPLHQMAGVKRLVVSTYQAASGAGAAAMAELEQQARDFAAGDPYTTEIFGRQYLWNLFSHNSPIYADNGYNQEEWKMVKETPKIFGDEFGIAVTCVRVPVLRAHCESINIEFNRKVTLEEVHAALEAAPGVIVVDDRVNNKHPEPLTTSGQYNVNVGRIRMDNSLPGTGIEMFVAGDQLLKGAALNAVQVAELLLKK